MPYPHRLLLDILPQNTPNSQNLLLRCPPTDFTDLHRYLWCAVLPQNSQNSQNLAAWVWQECHTLLHLCSSVPSVGGSSLSEVSVRSVLICGSPFSARVSVRSVRSVGISFLPRISQIYTDTYGALFSHRIWQRGYGRNAIPSYICEHPCHLWEAFLCKKVLCVPCVLRVYLFSHGFHRSTQMLGCAEFNHGLSGLNGWQCANLTTSTSHHLNTYLISPHHHLTTTTSFHHFNTLSLRTQPSAGLPNTAGMTLLPPAVR